MSHKKLVAAAQQRPPFMEVLRLLPPYSVADVTRAYKEQARSLHPDAGGDPQDFKALHSAY
jgi:curved DNA-binding protein CbpA